MSKFNKAVVIGRFQPFHNGHAHMIEEALKIADEVYIVIGSASAYPNVMNPFTVAERRNMINLWMSFHDDISNKDIARVKFTQVDDYLYNEQKWKTEVRLAVKEKRGDRIAIVGAVKDAGSYWLSGFGWEPHHVDLQLLDGVPISASNYRHEYLRNPLAVPPSDMLPEATQIFLREYYHSPEWARLNEEQLHWDKELKKFEAYPYKGALNCCTADTVVVCNNHLLVIERKFAAGKGALALAGGHKNADETFLDAAIRELIEEVQIKVPQKVLRGNIKNSWLFDHPNRSAYFCKPTMAYYISIEPNANGSLPRVKGSDDAAKAFWMPMHEVVANKARFFDDHYQIVVAFTGI